MAIIYNSDVSKNIIQGARIQVNRDKVPNELAEKVVPTLEVNPHLVKLANVTASTSSSTTADLTVYTTPTDEDFYLTYALWSIAENATDDGSSTSLVCTPYDLNANWNILQIRGLTTTAQSETIAVNFDSPIRIKRNTAINVSHTTTAGVMSKGRRIAGYNIDNEGA